MKMEITQEAPTSPEKPEAEKPETGKPKESLGETVRFLFILFLAAIILRSFVFAPFSIPSGSMLPRMMIGDYLMIAKWPYGYSRYSFPFGIAGFDGRVFESAPRRGDIVVFRYPGGKGEDFVKRVIGLPRDVIQVRDGRLSINGEPVQRTRIADFLVPVSPNSPCRQLNPAAQPASRGPDGALLCAYPRYRETLPGGRSFEVLDQVTGPGDNTGPIMVPDGYYFVMGDNRDDSLDSRFPVSMGGVGFLPAENVLGRALVTFFSTDGSSYYPLPWTWFSAARWDRIGKTYS